MRKALQNRWNGFRCQLYGYRYPTIFVSCCPKSASTWFSHLLAKSIPGYSYFHPETFRRPDGSGFDITPDVLNEFSGRYCVSRSHTEASEQNLSALDREFRRYVFLARDLRDVTVSVYHHVVRYPASSFVESAASRRLPFQPIPHELVSRSKAECLDGIIHTIMPGLAAYLDRWITAAQQRENCLVMTYEGVTRRTEHSIAKVLRFFDISPQPQRIARLVRKYDRSRMENWRWKFRKGAIGEWRNELSEAQQRELHQICNNLSERLRSAA